MVANRGLIIIMAMRLFGMKYRLKAFLIIVSGSS